LETWWDTAFPNPLKQNAPGDGGGEHALKPYYEYFGEHTMNNVRYAPETDLSHHPKYSSTILISDFNSMRLKMSGPWLRLHDSYQ